MEFCRPRRLSCQATTTRHSRLVWTGTRRGGVVVLAGHCGGAATAHPGTDGPRGRRATGC